MRLHVSSEVGRLEGVIVHTPGHEVSIVNPEFKDELLFDDIIFEEDARAEHQEMLQIFETAMPENGSIYQITDLLKETFVNQEARSYFVEQLVRAFPEVNLQVIETDLNRLSPGELLQFALSGTTPAINYFNINPSPNLLFTRDLAVVINDHILLSRAAKKARVRESLMMQTLVGFHPLFEQIKTKSIVSTNNGSIEGGDILVYSEKIVLIGMSERTSFTSLMGAAEALLDSGVEHILAVDIPKKRSSMHLDTIFTFSDYDECIAFPPAILEQNQNIVHLGRSKGKTVSQMMPSLIGALEELTETDFTVIKCGGENRTNQFREQWTDGANVFALAPGVIVGYERNTNTFDELENHGYTIVSQYEFIEEFADGSLDPTTAGKMAITFKGHELCRGRGGARCMTQPIARLE